MESAGLRQLFFGLILALLPALLRAEDGLVAWYKLDDGTGTTAVDSSGNGNTGTLQNGPTWSSGGMIGGALNFDGSNDQVRVPRSASLDSGSMTIAVWGKITSSKSAHCDIIRKAAAFQTGYLLRWNFGDNKLRLHIDGKGITVVDTVSTSTYLNAWHHFAGSFDETTGTACLYVDGVLKAQSTGTSGPISHSADLYLMNAPYADQVAIPGLLDDVRIYNRVLSAAEISALAQVPPTAVADIFGTLPNQALDIAAPGVLINDSDFNLDPLTAVKDSDPAHGTLILNSNGAFIYTPENGFTGVDTFTYHANDGKGNDSAAVTVSITVSNTPPGLVAWYKFDEGAGGTTADASGNGYTGTLTNGPQWTAGVVGQGMSFDGTDDYVNNATVNWSIGGPVTVSFWNYAATADVQPACAFGVGNNTNARLTALAPWSDRRLYWDYGLFTGNGRISIDYTPYLDKWTLITMVSQGTGGKFKAIYINGILVASASVSDGPSQALSGLHVGYWSDGTSYFHKGKIDDFRLYNRVLAPGEIQALFPQLPPVAANDSYFVQTNNPLTVQAPGVLFNDLDPNIDSLTAVKDTSPAHGTLTLNSNGSFIYTPENGFNGTDTFTYHANDGHGNNSTPATVSIVVGTAPPNTIAWYKFDEGSGTVANDSSGNGNHGTLVSGVEWATGVSNNAVHTNGASSYVNLGTSSVFNVAANAPFTVAGWMKTTDQTGPILAFRNQATGNSVVDITVGGIGSADNGKLIGIVRNDNTGGNAAVAIGSPIADGAWHHFALTRNAGSTLELFMDATMVQTFTTTPAGGAITTNLHAIGVDQRWVMDNYLTPDDRYLDGYFDDVYIIGRKLTATEIRSLFPQFPPIGNADFYSTPPGTPLSIAAPGALINDTDKNSDILAAVKDSDPAHGALVLNADGSFSYTPEIDFAGIDTFTYHVNDGHGNNSAVATVTLTISDVPANLAVWYKFDEGGGLTAVDSSGNNNNGTLTSGPVWTPGLQSSALNFDGTDDYVSAPTFAWAPNGPVTVSFWNFVNAGDVRQSSVFGVGSSLTNRFQCHAPWDDKRIYWDYGDINADKGRIFVDYTPYLGKWTHISLVSAGVGGAFKAIYLNGNLVASASICDGPRQAISPLQVGHFAENFIGEKHHRGKVDDFRIYNRMLSAGEITQLAQPVATITAVTGVFTAPFKAISQNITLTATVAATTSPASEGTVTFQLKNGAANLGTAITANVANGTTSGIYVLPAGTPLGDYTIEARFNGTAAFAASTDNSHSLTVEPASTAVAAANSAVAFSVADQFATLSATVTSNAGVVNEGNVTFQIKNGASSIGSAISGAVANGAASASYTIPGGTPLGTYTIEASFAGTTFASSSDNAHTLRVVEPNSMSAENATIAYKAAVQIVTLNAIVTGAAGTVNEGTVTFQIKNGATNVGSAATSPTVSNGSASASYTLPAGTPAGTYSIVASFSGGPNFPPSSDNTKALTITKAATGTTASNSTAPYNFADQIISLSVQITSSAGVVNDGTVTFQLKSGAQNIGTAVTSGQITNGTTIVNYTVPGGTLPGAYTIQAAYSGGVNFAASSDNAKTLTLLKATPVITWPNPADIAYGTALGATQLNATASGIPGTFVYNPPAGNSFAVGNSQPLSVTFTPNDTVNYNSAQKTVAINVVKALLTVTADNQSKLFGAPNPPLTASYSGFVNGESASVLTGAPTLSTSVTTSTPPGNYPILIAQGALNAANYTFAFVNGTLTVSNQPAFFNLSAPSVPYKTATTTLSGRISFGASGAVSITMNGVTKSASIDASGFFTADFSTGTLELGTYPIQYFYPGGGAIGPASDTRNLTVIKAAPVITWPNPAEVPYGTQLSNTQLNATASVAGTFAYNPPAGTVLTKGTHRLSTNFTPADAVHFINVSASATLVVGLAQATITWATPADISYGTALSEAQFNATADIPGAFVYNPGAGTILDAGDTQLLSLIFTPNDPVNYAVSRIDVFINVLKADQAITFDQIADQEIGSPQLTLSATASSNLPLTISLVSGNATLQGTTLTLLGLGPVTLRAEQTGNTNFNAAPTLEQTFNVIIIPSHLTSALSASGTKGQPFTFTLTATGTQPVTFESGTLPPGLSLNGNTGEISGTPTASGAFQIAVTARNGGGSETKTLTLVFANSGGGKNHAPAFISAAVVTPNPATVNLEISFNASASDEDGDSIAVVWDFGDGTQGFGSSTTHRYLSAGLFAARVTITDGVASDYLNLTIVVNGTVIPPDQYKQYVVSKLGLKFNFAKPNLDSLSISGTVPVPPAFSPEGKVVKFESAELQREWTLDKKATSADKAFKLTGKFAKDGTLTGSPAKFALALKNQDLFTGLASLGFVNDNTPKGMIVPMPVILVVDGTGYLATLDVKYAAKKGKSGSGKK